MRGFVGRLISWFTGAEPEYRLKDTESPFHCNVEVLCRCGRWNLESVTYCCDCGRKVIRRNTYW